MVKIRKAILDVSRWDLKCPFSMTPEFVVIHNTANDAPAENEIAYMGRNDSEVSFHYAVDDTEAVQGIPEDRNAWHAGDGGTGEANRRGIAIEICCSKSGGEKFEKSEQNAASLAADILKRYGWGIEKVRKHQDFNGKNCPHRTLELGWERFLDMVKAELEGVVKAPEVPAKKPVDAVVREVIRGEWGNGDERKTRLAAAGHDPKAVQAEVNRILLGKAPEAPAKKPVDAVVREVIRGEWGNGAERKTRLAAAGYDAAEVQKRVNEALR